MFNFFVKYYICVLFFLLSIPVKSQKKDSIEINKKNSIFVEIGGWSRFYSLNYNRMINLNNFLTINVYVGFSYSIEYRRTIHYDDYELKNYIIPISSTISIGKKINFFELGLCVSPYFYQDSVVLTLNYNLGVWEKKTKWYFSNIPFLVIGYKHIFEKNVLFRFTVLPIISNKSYWDFTQTKVGLGIGVSFGKIF